jgi:hypothetical protein
MKGQSTGRRYIAGYTHTHIRTRVRTGLTACKQMSDSHSIIRNYFFFHSINLIMLLQLPADPS